MIEDKHKIIIVNIPRTVSSGRARIIANVPKHEFTQEVMHSKYWNVFRKHAKAVDYREYYPKIF